MILLGIKAVSIPNLSPTWACDLISVATIKTLQGDITELNIDVIVNAANHTLLGGGGVDGAIHRVAGPELLAACRKLGGCKTGEAKITDGYHLPCRYVIHTVGPVWSGGQKREPELLESCYRNSLKLAQSAGVQTVAFPSISTGVYRFPMERACRIAVDTVRSCLEEMQEIEKVLFVCFSAQDLDVYRKTLTSSN